MPTSSREAIKLLDLLSQPREELAKKSDELLDRVKFQQRSLQERRTEQALLPTFRLPLVVPVWRDAKFSAKVGFSLPPYAKEDGKDSVLALHLARFGDLEAARKLAESADLPKLEAFKLDRNYPVEWVRFVSLLLHEAQMRTAAGDQEGLQSLLDFHRQLGSVLDAKAAKGVLGAALLPRGRRVLTESAAAWRTQKRAEPAELADKAIKEWGDAPTAWLAIEPGASRVEVERLLGTRGQGRAVAATELTRALDLLNLPIPEDGVRAVVAFFDLKDRFTQVQVTYREGMAEVYAQPGSLAHHLEESIKGNDGEAAGAKNRTYQTPGLQWNVMVLTHRIGVGAVVRCQGKDQASTAVPTLPRDLGVVHLDRSFEQNRLRIAPEQRGDTLTVKQPKVLAQVTSPVEQVKPVQAVLQRHKEQNLTGQLVLRHTFPREAAPELHRLAAGLWTAFGPSEFHGGDANHLALVWRDGKTEYWLKLAFAGGTVDWAAVDCPGPDLTKRAAEVTAFDERERAARVQAGQPLTRIPRWRERLELGMKRDQVSQLLPVGQAVHKRDIAGGILVTSMAEPAPNAAAIARQIVLRFDRQSRLAELRVRYVDGPAAKGQDPLSDLIRRAGVSQEGPTSSAVVWSDLSQPGKPLVQHYWQDDVTSVTCVRDGNVTEVELRDRTAEQSAAPLLEYLPRGPTGCVLGMARDDLLRQWNVANPETIADGALVLRPQTPRPYDVLMVWFDNDRVARIVARHEAGASRGPAPAQLAQAVSEAWGRDLRLLGWPSRQDQTPQGALLGLGWHDGVTRVRTFWQEQDVGLPRVYTEWKSLGSP